MNPCKLPLGIALNQLASYEELVLKKQLPGAGGTERSVFSPALGCSPASELGEPEAKTVRRFVIIGGPRTGKTTLAERLGQSDAITNVRSTDSLIHLGWSGASAAASRWFDEPGDWIIEGVAAPRALRKWLLAHPEAAGLEALRVICLWKPFNTLSRGQKTMATGVRTVWNEIANEVRRHGATVHEDWVTV